jgi:hypothetical protein
MLSSRHNLRVVSSPARLQDRASTPHDVLAELRALRQPPTMSSSLLRTRSTAFALEDFARRHTAVRDDLAWKAARGLPLTDVERATLHALDAILDATEAPSAPLSDEVKGILRDVLRP